jgi:hypothetical protein
MIVYMPAVARGISLFFFCLLARGQSVDDAVGALAKRVVARLAAAETARVTWRNVSSLPASDAAKIQPAFNRAVQRRVRNPMPVDVTLTISENVRGFLLVAEIKHEDETAVEMAEFQRDPSPAPARSALALERRLLWEQEAPILDVAVQGDQMFVLDAAGVTRYERVSGKWEQAAAFAIASEPRDPRGRLELDGDAVAIQLPGLKCTGPAKLSQPVACEEGGPLVALRNTFDLHDWRGEFFASAEAGGDTLLAELDGRTHVYDSAHGPQAAFEGWGSDFAAVAACGGSHIVASAAGDRQSADSIALYDLVNRAPVRMSEPLEFPGPVTALWPSGDGAMAVVRNLSTGRYAAYNLTLDCGR